MRVEGVVRAVEGGRDTEGGVGAGIEPDYNSGSSSSGFILFEVVVEAVVRGAWFHIEVS